MRLIDADAFRDVMYHDAFETGTSDQRWDSGNWIRYRLFERNLKSAPTIDAVPIVQCENCKNCYFASNRIPSEQTYVCDKHGIDVKHDWFCKDGVKKDE